MRRACLCLIMLSAAPALAADEHAARARLHDTQSSLRSEQSHQQELAEQTGKVGVELKGLQHELVQLTGNIRNNQRGLLDAEDKLEILNRQLAEKSAALKQQRAELASMVEAAIRLSHTPPEAGIMMPGDFMQAAEAARVLSSLAGSIRRESRAVAAQMEELEDLKRRVQQDQSRIDASQSALKQEQETLDGKLGERKRLAAQLLQEQQDVKRRMSELSRQAKDLKQLLAGLEKARTEEEKKARARTKEAHVAPPAVQPSVPVAKGKFTMPVDGRLVQRFGESLSKNQTSKGIIIRARAGAQVVAPYAGEVVFNGPFLDYGNMVILRHSDDFHTLLAGVNATGVSVGEFLLEGEPIGVMGNSPTEDLYVELRKANQPIDPAPWISGLSR